MTWTFLLTQPIASADDVTGESAPVVVIDVLDVIGEAGFLGDGVTPKAIADALRDSRGADVHVRINSLGGDAFDGLAIAGLLAAHQGHVTTEVLGVAASAASVIAAAGREIVVADNALLMLHEASMLVIGPAEDHQRAIDVLDRLNSSYASAYAACSRKRGKKRTAADFRKLMRAETWISATEARDMGLCDRVGPAQKAAACAAWVPVSPPMPPPAQPKDKDNRTMNKFAIELQRILGIDTVADDEPAVVAQLSVLAEQRDAGLAAARDLAAVYEMFGEATLDGIRGAHAAMHAAVERAAELEAEIARRDEQAVTAEASLLLAQLKAERRISPAQVADLWPSLSIDGKRAFAKSAPVLVGADQLEPTASNAATGAGVKPWIEMSNQERASLFLDNRALYNELKAQHERSPAR